MVRARACLPAVMALLFLATGCTSGSAGPQAPGASATGGASATPGGGVPGAPGGVAPSGPAAGSPGGPGGPATGTAGPGGGRSGSVKPLPRGVFASVGPVRSSSDDRVVERRGNAGGVLLAVPWNLCDQECLLDVVERNLATAQEQGARVALIVSDGAVAPDDVKDRCATFPFQFRGTNQTMCLPWDANYLKAKKSFVQALGARVDDHPALAYTYFTGACSTNGNEGHCRVDQSAFTAAGYTSAKLTGAYREIMGVYRAAFPRTPLIFEAHTIFDRAEPWTSLWNDVAASGRVGVAAWWCSERLSLRGGETVPVWSLVQAAAQASFSVCQTVGSFSKDPAQFSDPALGLDYSGSQASQRAFDETLDWVEGKAVHAGQSAPIHRFSVLESWWEDCQYASFAQRLAAF